MALAIWLYLVVLPLIFIEKMENIQLLKAKLNFVLILTIYLNPLELNSPALFKGGFVEQ